MKPVYYFDKTLGYCPVKKYLEQYEVKNKDTLKIIIEKEKLAINIRSKVDFAVKNNGRPIPPICKALIGCNFFEIRARKDKNILIRVFYFRFDNLIVLLNAIEKSDHDNDAKDKRTMKKCLSVTEKYYKSFIINPKSYEEYI